MSEIQWKNIESIDLNDPQYGESLNDRFKAINDNFKGIVESEYLKGDKGDNYGVMATELNNEDESPIMYYTDNQELTPKSLYSIISSSLSSLKSSRGDNSKLDDYGLNGLEVILIYCEIGGKKILQDILPFTYIDRRFKGELGEIHKNIVDLSCVMVWDKNANSFKATNSIPYIYYDKNISGGEFCWAIYGEKSGIPCKGPKGNDGAAASMYVAYIDKENAEDVKGISGEVLYKKYPLLCVLAWGYIENPDGKAEKKYTQIKPEDFDKNEVIINNGVSTICFPAAFHEETSSYHVLPLEGDKYGCLVGGVEKEIVYNADGSIKEEKYGVVSSNDCVIAVEVAMTVLKNQLERIGDTSGIDSARGLFIPTLNSSGYHMIWDEDGSAHVGKVNKIEEGFEVISDETLYIDYDNLNVNNINTKEININKNHRLKDEEKNFIEEPIVTRKSDIPEQPNICETGYELECYNPAYHYFSKNPDAKDDEMLVYFLVGNTLYVPTEEGYKNCSNGVMVCDENYKFPTVCYLNLSDQANKEYSNMFIKCSLLSNYRDPLSYMTNNEKLSFMIWRDEMDEKFVAFIKNYFNIDINVDSLMDIYEYLNFTSNHGSPGIQGLQRRQALIINIFPQEATFQRTEFHDTFAYNGWGMNGVEIEYIKIYQRHPQNPSILPADNYTYSLQSVPLKNDKMWLWMSSKNSSQGFPVISTVQTHMSPDQVKDLVENREENVCMGMLLDRENYGYTGNKTEVTSNSFCFNIFPKYVNSIKTYNPDYKRITRIWKNYGGAFNSIYNRFVDEGSLREKWNALIQYTLREANLEKYVDYDNVKVNNLEVLGNIVGNVAGVIRFRVQDKILQVSYNGGVDYEKLFDLKELNN